MSEAPPVTEADFLEKRVEFFHGFTRAVLYVGIGIVVLLALMGIFLV